ncbi:MAG: 16S rRNA processing protein RimM, partial [Clostridia bacterium]|nr:16S rRNA processing protein RimM [Clostridia bacterium]
MDYLRIALIARPHGVQGAVKLMPLSEDINRYHGLKEA